MFSSISFLNKSFHLGILKHDITHFVTMNEYKQQNNAQKRRQRKQLIHGSIPMNENVFSSTSHYSYEFFCYAC